MPTPDAPLARVGRRVPQNVYWRGKPIIRLPIEREAAQALAAAWNDFLRLLGEHPDDTVEFRQGLHALQDKVLSRSVRRAMDGKGTEAPSGGETA